MKSFLLIMSLLAVGFVQAQQVETRVEDHFWRRRVVKRIDLNEKINQPLIYHDDQVSYGKQRYSEKNGLIQALIHGVEMGKYKVYDPDNSKELDWAALDKKMRKLNHVAKNFDKKALAKEGQILVNEFDRLLAEEEEMEAKSLKAGKEEDEEEVIPATDYTPFEQILQVVEDYTFDKGQSRMFYNVDFFQIIWSDPQGLLPDRILANFRYKDVVDILEQTQWKHRFNEAEIRSVKEIFDLHLYHAILVNVAGIDVHSLAEAQKRELEILEYEHNLWQY
ncbi:MAG: hypothetical protein ACKVTZ_09275 [Bacteroidia bacterium]